MKFIEHYVRSKLWREICFTVYFANHVNISFSILVLSGHVVIMSGELIFCTNKVFFLTEQKKNKNFTNKVFDKLINE